MRKIISTFSRNISFGDFTINPGETKEFPEKMSIPEEYKTHLHLIEERNEEKVKKIATKSHVEESTETIKKINEVIQ